MRRSIREEDGITAVDPACRIRFGDPRKLRGQVPLCALLVEADGPLVPELDHPRPALRSFTIGQDRLPDLLAKIGASLLWREP
jgi:hypothetical protein